MSEMPITSCSTQAQRAWRQTNHVVHTAAAPALASRDKRCVAPSQGREMCTAAQLGGEHLWSRMASR